MSLAGRDAKLQVNGTSGSWNELAITEEAALSLEQDLYETTSFGQDGVERGAEGPLDTSLEITFNTQASQPTAATDIRDSALNGTEVQFEFSPDGNTSGGPTDVFAFKAKCSTYDPSDASVGSKQTTSATVENSDGTKVSVSGTFSP